MRQGIRRGGCPLPPWGLCLLVALGALSAQATTLTTELNASRDSRGLTLLGDVELQENETFLTFGYSGLRPQTGTATTHQLSAGLDHALNEHWLLSGSVQVGLPNTTRTVLSQERPRLNLPALAAHTSSSSQGLVLSAGYDSGGLSDVEYGFDLGLGLNRYPFKRALVTHTADTTPTVIFRHQEQLGVLRPSLGARLTLGGDWELGLRGGLYLYNEDPLSAGQFTAEEQQTLTERYARVAEDSGLQGAFLKRLYQQLGTTVATRLTDVNATSGLPSAPAQFDVKPSITYRFSAKVRGQLSYLFTRYVPGQGHGHVLGTRWTFRLGEPLRLWAAVAVQADVPEDTDPVYTGLATLGAEYTF